MYEAGDGRRVADACNVSQSLVSQWKCGSRKVPVRYRKTIARVLKVSMKSLWPPEGKA
jgi:DNA-binding transcriptional regulator YdaS (Cro superfamily)